MLESRESVVYVVACDLCGVAAERQPTEVGAKAAAGGAGYVNIVIGNAVADGKEMQRWVCPTCVNKIGQHSWLIGDKRGAVG
jgi:hypothetical protein